MQNSILYMYFLKHCWAPYFCWGDHLCQSEINYKEYILKDYSKIYPEKAIQKKFFCKKSKPL